MLAFRSVPVFSVVLAILGALAAPAFTARAVAIYRGSVHINSRVCPPGALLLYRDCHGSPGPAGAMYAIDTRKPKPADADGNVSFGQVMAGDHLVTITAGYDTKAYSRLQAYCSNSATGMYPTIATIHYSDTPQFWVRVAPRSRLTCDVYFIP